ncbi:MAG TPA: SgcJ/EcaC family oxidoreductase [Haliangiales bacterium]|nr:SgcJ/EcaC family oxidoreductase [Haliangiales bacterium]
MDAKHALVAVLLAAFGTAAPARAEDLRAVMEAENARWLAAFNGRHPEAFPALYAKDAVLLPPGGQPVSGRDAIAHFWAEGLKETKVKDHTFEIVSMQRDGNLAYQVARWTVTVPSDKGEAVKHTGNTVRIFERQSDGTWLTKVHIFNHHE